jgi:hypothetical protein
VLNENTITKIPEGIKKPEGKEQKAKETKTGNRSSLQI